MKYFLYQLLKKLLFLFDPETVHNLMVRFGVLLGKTALGRKLTWLLYGYKGKEISIEIDGIKYNGPVLLSAGFDYNAQLISILPSLGFAGVEVGSVTAKACPGNPKPRLTRLIKNQSILVNKGLRNDGVETIIKRIKNSYKQPGFIIGVNIARTNDKDTTTTEQAIADYSQTLKRLTEENVGDYYTINISCPNAFGGETFADNPRLLEQLLAKLKEIKTPKPIYIKMPINKSWTEFNELLKIIVKYQYNGVVIGNLNKNYADLQFRNEAPAEYRGGLSGKPTFQLSNELIRKTRKEYKDKLTIFGVGGILSAADALTKLEAGADLLMLITGMIFTGPQLISEINQLYSRQA